MSKQQFLKGLERGNVAKGRPRSVSGKGGSAAADARAMQMIPIIELCRHNPGMVTALGVSIGLTAGPSSSGGPSSRKSAGFRLCSRSRRSAPGPSPSRGSSDGSDEATARRDGNEYVLN